MEVCTVFLMVQICRHVIYYCRLSVNFDWIFFHVNDHQTREASKMLEWWVKRVSRQIHVKVGVRDSNWSKRGEAFAQRRDLNGKIKVITVAHERPQHQMRWWRVAWLSRVKKDGKGIKGKWKIGEDVGVRPLTDTMKHSRKTIICESIV